MAPAAILGNGQWRLRCDDCGKRRTASLERLFRRLGWLYWTGSVPFVSVCRHCAKKRLKRAEAARKQRILTP